LIRHLLHKEINKLRWDSCLEQSVNPLPNASSWWLDVVSPEWEALVQDDYNAVMPLTRNRKLGIDYLFQPCLTQQLGVFSPDAMTPEETGLFLASIPAKYIYIDIQLNAMNLPVNSGFHFKTRMNYTLNLTPAYFQLSANYHRNCRRNIQKAIHAGLTVKPGPDPTVFTRFVERNLDKRIAEIGKNMYPVLQKITNASIQHGTGDILGVYKLSGELLAAGWFVTGNGRCLFEVCASTREGKENQAMYMLVDHVIREKSGSELIFDFTGSNLPGVAYFNAGFGASRSTYMAAKRNLLPWPFKILKK
jgi:hypothetical protein